LGVSFALVAAVLWPSMAHYVAAGQLGTAYGVMTMLQNAGLALGNMIAGYLNDLGGAGPAQHHGIHRIAPRRIRFQATWNS
jgi:MFS family permease